MAEIIKLGSLYFNGQPQEVGVKYNGGQISFGPVAHGKELQWVKVNGLLIADRSICTNVSWEQLNDHGLIFGTPVQIDGQFYLCRCLKVGAKEGVPNEWDAALDQAGDSNDLWHWEHEFFWGQETTSRYPTYRAFRGYESARIWDLSNATSRSVYVGFRPALEPLGSVSCPPDALIGKPTRIYGPRGMTLEGHLLSADNYDLVLEAASPIPDKCSWVSKDGNKLVVDWSSILWLKEA